MEKSIFVLIIAAFMTSGCAGFIRQESVTPMMTWSSAEEAMDNYRKIVEGASTLSEIKTRGFDPSKVSNAQIVENPTKIRDMIMGPNPNVRYDDLTKYERACLDAKENRRAIDFPVRITVETSEGNLLLETLRFKKVRRETGKQLHVWLCYDAESEKVLYKTISYGPINNLKKYSDPLPEYVLLLLLRAGF